MNELKPKRRSGLKEKGKKRKRKTRDDSKIAKDIQ